MCNISSLYLNRGITKGKAEGAFEATTKMIIKLFKKGMPIADIADAAELSVSETEKIINENT